MQIIRSLFKGCIIAFLFLAYTTAGAEPGDNEAVAKARKDYEEAVKSQDIGRINAMKIELSVQLAKAKQRNNNIQSGNSRTAATK